MRTEVHGSQFTATAVRCQVFEPNIGKPDDRPAYCLFGLDFGSGDSPRPPVVSVFVVRPERLHKLE